MRREYEAAIGRLITNHTALALFLRDENAFLHDYDLDENERDNIVATKGQLPGMCASFTGKRKSMIERPVAKTLALLGNYGEILIRRYLNLYPPSGDYTLEHEVFIRFLEEAITSHDGPDNTKLVLDVLKLESALFRALRSIVPGEEIEHINDPEPVWAVQVDSDSKLAVRNGVLYSQYQYNLAEITQMEAKQVARLSPERTALIVLRGFGEVSNTILRVSPTVLQALKEFGTGKSVKDVATALAKQSGSSFEITLDNLIKLANQLCSQQVLIEMKV